MQRRELFGFAAAVVAFTGSRIVDSGGTGDVQPAEPVLCDLVTLLCLGRSASAAGVTAESSNA